MSEARRQHEVMVRLNDAELARLDEIRPPGSRGRSLFAISCVGRRPTVTLPTGPRPWRSCPSSRGPARSQPRSRLSGRCEPMHQIDDELAQLLRG